MKKSIIWCVQKCLCLSKLPNIMIIRIAFIEWRLLLCSSFPFFVAFLDHSIRNFSRMWIKIRHIIGTIA